jgi:hypothetical protein
MFAVDSPPGVTVGSGYRDQDRLIVIARLGEAGDKIKAPSTPAAMQSFMPPARGRRASKRPAERVRPQMMRLADRPRIAA